MADDESKPRWSSVAIATQARYAILNATAYRRARAERSIPFRATCCAGMSVVPRVASEMALHVLAYNLTRVLNIMGVKGLMQAIAA